LERAPQCPQAEDARVFSERALSLFAIGVEFGSGRARHSLVGFRISFVSATYDSQSVLGSRLSNAGHDAKQLSPSVVRPNVSDSSTRRIESSRVLNARRNTKDSVLFGSDLHFPPLMPSAPSMTSRRLLRRPVSLPSIAHYAGIQHKTSSISTPDDSFYPSYLHRGHEPRVRAPKLPGSTGEPNLGSSVPISRALIRPSAPELPFYDSTDNSALWNGIGWDTMQQKPSSDATPTLPGLSPPRGSLVGEWNSINLGETQ
jgi:hypothetical protein